jgi:phage protein D
MVMLVMTMCSLPLAKGRPELFPELPATVGGCKPAIDRADRLIAQVTHRLHDSGLVTERRPGLSFANYQNQ